MRKILLIIGLLLLGVAMLYQARSFIPGPAVSESESYPVEWQETSPLAQELYRHRNPYVGDASKNGQITRLLGISESVGTFHMELETDARPYVLRLVLDQTPEDQVELNVEMDRYSMLLFALIDNVDEIHWVYPLELQNGEERISLPYRRELLYMTLEAAPESFELTPVVLDQIMDIV
jgi:hypothetical protein